MTSVHTQTAPYGALLLRLALGVVFLAHAWLKLSAMGFSGTGQFFASFGFPAWTTYPVFAAEIGGGLMLLAGWHVRLASVLLLPVAIGALRVHGPNGWVFAAPGGGWEYIAFLIVALTAQALLGDGAFAVTTTRRQDVQD